MEHEIRGVDIDGQEVTLSGPPDLLDIIQNATNAYMAAKNAAELVTDTALFAGLDRDGQAKLYAMRPGSNWLIPVNHAMWLKAVDSIGSLDGEMVGVCLIRLYAVYPPTGPAAQVAGPQETTAMNTITQAERAALVASAKRYITLDDAGEIVLFEPTWQAFAEDAKISGYRARAYIARAAAEMRGETAKALGRPVALDGSAVRLTVWLEPAHVATANWLGDGNTSAGVRRALDEYANTERCLACKRTPAVAGPLNGLGFCGDCERSFEQHARDNQSEPHYDAAEQYRPKYD